jgi:hypothetical protein
MNAQLSFLLDRSLEALRIGNQGSAELYLNQALRIQSNNPHVLRLLGVLAAQKRDYQKAISFLLDSLKVEPKNFLTHSNLGNIFLELRRYDEALFAYDKSLKLEPKYEEAWLNKGNALHQLKRFDEAIENYDQALSLKPDYAEAYSNKGNVLLDLARFEDAIAHYDQALNLNPGYAEAWLNRGYFLHQVRRYDEAIAHYDHALSLRPDYARAYSNKGNVLQDLKRFDEAIAHYDQALHLKPDYADAAWNKGLSLLLQGDFENGLPLYESRWASEKVSEIAGKRIFDAPLWLGKQSLKNKTILLYGEQGLGDFIQFCRYTKLVSNLGAKIVLEAPEALAPLMRHLEGVNRLVLNGQELPPHDYQCPILSLPLAFQTKIDNIPNANSYISLDDQLDKVTEWNKRLGLKTKPRIGLVWSGNAQHKNDHNRSFALKDLLPYLPEKFEYISLQKEIREDDQSILGSNPQILSFANHLNDFSDTAALINGLDLVISVDTSVAHLSGALGKETWVLLPYVPDWRWLLDREDSPWYPSMKLYRQLSPGNWTSVLSGINENLRAIT